MAGPFFIMKQEACHNREMWHDVLPVFVFLLVMMFR